MDAIHRPRVRKGLAGVQDLESRLALRASDANGRERRERTRRRTHRPASLAVLVLLLGAAASQAEDLAPRPEQTGRIQGAVRDRDGRPLAGVRIRLTQRVGWFDRAEAETRTAGDGRFELRWIEPGRYELWAEHKGHGTQTLLLGLAAGEALEAELVLRRTGIVFGRVADGSGRLVSEARLLVRRADGSVLLDALAEHEAAGCYELEGLAAGDYWITALAAGYAPETAALPIRVDPLSSVRADFRLGAGGTLRVRIRGRQDRPLVGRAVRIDRLIDGTAFPLTELGTWSTDPPRMALTDPEGVAEVPLLEPGIYRVLAAGGGSQPAEVLVREGRRTEVLLELPS
jgi:hypothetical protein